MGGRMDPTFFALHLLPAVLRSWPVSRSRRSTELSLNRKVRIAEKLVAEEWEMNRTSFLTALPPEPANHADPNNVAGATRFRSGGFMVPGRTPACIGGAT